VGFPFDAEAHSDELPGVAHFLLPTKDNLLENRGTLNPEFISYCALPQ
jgi:hypothetical protein